MLEQQQNTVEAWESRVDELATRVMIRGLDGATILDLKSLADLAEAAESPECARLARELAGRLEQALSQTAITQGKDGGKAASQVADALVKNGLTELRAAMHQEHGGEPPPPAYAPLGDDAELVADFLVEAREHLSQIEGQMLVLERDPEVMEVIHAVFRAFHTIKGLAGFLGFGVVQAVAHEVETLLDLARNAKLVVDSAIVDVVLESGDFLLGEMSSIEQALGGGTPQTPADNRDLIARIRVLAVPALPVASAVRATTVPGSVSDSGAASQALIPITATIVADDDPFGKELAESSANVQPDVSSADAIKLGPSTAGPLQPSVTKERTASPHQAEAESTLPNSGGSGVQEPTNSKARKSAQKTGKPKATKKISIQQSMVSTKKELTAAPQVMAAGPGTTPGAIDALAAHGGNTTQSVAVRDTSASSAAKAADGASRIDSGAISASAASPSELGEVDEAAGWGGMAEPAPEPGAGELLTSKLPLVVTGSSPASTDKKAEVLLTGPATRSALPGPASSPLTPTRPAEPVKAPDASSVRVETAKLDHLMDMVGEMVIAQSLIRHSPVLAAASDSRLVGDLSQLARVTAEVQRATMSMRMVPVGQLFQKIERVIRDLSRKAGKQVVLETSGTDTAVDKTVAEELSDPLLHMVRNSCDHGVETPAERVAAGKDAAAKIRLAAYHQGGQVVIEIGDDGRGLNAEKIRRKAEQNELISSTAQLTDTEIYQLIFEPGFSTAEKITDVSGRGVGMDVVRRNVEKLRGRIETQSVLGHGTTFLLKLPLTLAIIDGLVVEVGVHRYIIPLSVVREIYRPLQESRFTVEGRDEMMLVREQLLPVVRLAQRLQIEGRSILPSDGLLVIVESENKRFCLLVDDLVGKQEVVIKGLGETFEGVWGVSGCAVLGDGRVGLILDTDGIYRGRRR